MTRKFTNLSAQEIERRRKQSATVWAERNREEFERWYQERLDRFYWQNGKCCAGCDHWSSEAGDMGQCNASPPVSGHQVLKSMGIEWTTLPDPPPGQPYTKHDHVCGTFKDEFDWACLGEVYLKAIGYHTIDGDG